MKYELWDHNVGVAIDASDDESEIKNLIRTLVYHHGEDEWENLSLSIYDYVTISGEELREWTK